jgi:hypothetical protein
MRSTYSLAARLLHASWILAVAWASSAVAPSGSVEEKPPPTAATVLNTGTELVYSAQLHGSVRIQSREQQVEVVWRHSPTGSFLHENVRSVETQRRSTNYWPTSAEVIVANKIAVAGKERGTGYTRIEVWTLTAPSFEVPSAGPGLQPQPDLVADVQLVYRAAIPGRDTVSAMVHVRGKPSSLFVQFYDSRDLYELDWSTPARPISLVLERSSEPGLGVDGYNYIMAGDHKTQGFVYVFMEVDCVPTIEGLVLCDSDRDGDIDTHAVMRLATYHALGLAKRDQWRELDGRCE